MTSIKLISPIAEVESPGNEQSGSHQKLKIFKTIQVTGESKMRNTPNKHINKSRSHTMST